MFQLEFAMEQFHLFLLHFGFIKRMLGMLFLCRKIGNIAIER